MAKKKKKITKKITRQKVSPKKAIPKKVVTKKKPVKKVAKKKVAKKQSAAVIKSPSLKANDPAPDFTLKDQNGKEISLKDFRGRNVVVYFYPKAMTPGCTVQACSLRDSTARLNDLDIVILGISPDPVKKLKQFEEKQGLNFILLSDEDHAVAETYGSWGQKKFMGREYMGILRQSFLVGPDGKILHVLHQVDTKTHHEVVMEFFRNRG